MYDMSSMGNLKNLSDIYSKLDSMIDDCVSHLRGLFHFRGDAYYHHDTGIVEVLLKDKTLLFKDSSFEHLLVYLDLLHIFLCGRINLFCFFVCYFDKFKGITMNVLIDDVKRVIDFRKESGYYTSKDDVCFNVLKGYFEDIDSVLSDINK